MFMIVETVRQDSRKILDCTILPVLQAFRGKCWECSIMAFSC